VGTAPARTNHHQNPKPGPGRSKLRRLRRQAGRADRARHAEVHGLLGRALTIIEISRTLRLERKTVRRYATAVAAGQLFGGTRLSRSDRPVRGTRDHRDLVREFADMLCHQHGEHLEAWAAQAETSPVSGLRGFSKGLRKDWAAGLTTPTAPAWSKATSTASK
jgi:hypothetical protein